MSKKKKRILVVDDDLAQLQALRLALTTLGYEPVVVDTPEKFRQQLNENSDWSAAVMDVVLPEGGRLGADVGLKLARETWKKCPDLPAILMITAYKDEEDRIALCAKEIGASYVLKPLGRRVLDEELRKVMGGK